MLEEIKETENQNKKENNVEKLDEINSSQNIETKEEEEKNKSKVEAKNTGQGNELNEKIRGIIPVNKSKAGEEKNTKDSKKVKIIITISTIFLILLFLLFTIFAILNINSAKIVKGIKIENVEMAGKTEQEAIKILQEIYEKNNDNRIILKHGEYEESITVKTLEPEYKINEAVKKAYKIGRSGKIFIDNYEIVKTNFKEKSIEVEAHVNKEMLKQIALNINNNIKDGVIQAEYFKEGNKLIINSGKQGLKVNEEELQKILELNIKKKEKDQQYEIPFETQQPDPIDIEKIHKDIYKKTQDAYYIQEPFTIYPEVEGVDFDKETAKAVIANKQEKYEIPLIITRPKKTVREIGTEAFPDLITEFSTRYNPGQIERTTNLRIATQKIDGYVLLPGAEFSYNRVVGERTAAKGFKNAPIYSNGKVIDGLGGGICQISSTLYNAVVQADLQITKRRNHQFVTSYVPAGKDATVVWGSQDFRFKNTRKMPIKIKASVKNGVATIQIWGRKEETEYNISIETIKKATIPMKTEVVIDNNLAAGQKKVIQKGHNGTKVEAYKVKRLNGKVISRTLLSKDTYNAMKQIIHEGPIN